MEATHLAVDKNKCHDARHDDDRTGPPTDNYVSIGSSVTNKFTTQSLKDQYYRFGNKENDHDILGRNGERYTVLLDGDDKSDDKNYLKPLFQKNVSFIEADIREGTPAGPFDLVLCRNLAFTYFASGLQEAVLQGIEAVLRPGGALVLGKHERLPETGGTFRQLEASQPIYWKVSGVSSGPVGSRP